MFIKDGKRFDPFRPHTIDGVKYPNLRSPELRAKLNITEIPDPTPPEDYSDDTYYVTTQNDPPYTIWTRKSDEQIAQTAQAKLNEQSLRYLAETDWMLIRQMEDFSKPVPEDILAKRAEARASIVK